MTCCRHLVDDHTPAGCVWCACRVTREEHADRPEVDGLEDWRRAGGPLAEWTLSDMNTTNNPGLTSLDYGNHETMAIGMVREGDGWLCLTLTESARLKTERGAIAWLARRGYRPDGSRSDPDPTSRGPITGGGS